MSYQEYDTANQQMTPDHWEQLWKAVLQIGAGSDSFQRHRWDPKTTERGNNHQ
jgi:hypothetical protein